MSTAYSIDIPVTMSKLMEATNNKVKLLAYPIAEYANGMCLIEHNGDTFEVTHNNDQLLTIVYRYNGDLASLNNTFQDCFGKQIDYVTIDEVE